MTLKEFTTPQIQTFLLTAIVGVISGMGAALGLTDEQLDDLFVQAQGIDA